MAALTARYRQRKDRQTAATPDQTREGRGPFVPLETAQAIRDIFGCEQHRFATPLTVAEGVTAYYSLQPGDADFGARHDPLRARWTGTSLCTPPWDTAILSKAVAWAIRSATVDAPAADTPAPVLTVLVAPDMGGEPAFQAHLEAHPQYCKLLASIGKGGGGGVLQV